MKPATSALAKSAALLLALASISCLAQNNPAQTSPAPTPAAPATGSTAPAHPAPSPAPPSPFNRTVILLDPAHGGLDSGSRISESIVEKDVTLTFAFKLRSLLAARGFSVVMTRDSDAATLPNTPGTPLTLDDRAGIANHAHPVACLLLHATAAGAGIHLYSSELDAPDPNAAETFGAPWLTAQAAWVTQSQRLQKSLGLALTRANIPLVQSRASVRPVDSLTCPALVVELAPNAGDNASLIDSTYQQHVAEVIATALVFWQNQAQPPDRATPTPTGAQP